MHVISLIRPCQLPAEEAGQVFQAYTKSRYADYFSANCMLKKRLRILNHKVFHAAL